MDTLQGKTLITGGTGLFGRNFAKHLLAQSELKKLIIFLRNKLKQSQVVSEMKYVRLRFFIGDVRDISRLERAFDGVDVVVYAAAPKQVSANAIEAALNKGVGDHIKNKIGYN